MKRNRFRWFLPIVTGILLTIGNSCRNDDSATEGLKIGETYQGGIIFNIDVKGEHGLVSAPSDQSSTDPWWNGSFVTTGAVSTSNGAANTAAIINVQGSSGVYAARLCKDYRGGGYNDWFLHSKDQLNILFSKKNVVGNFSTQIYWSSSEYETGEAWVQDFETGDQYLDNVSDGANVNTRAIRAF